MNHSDSDVDVQLKNLLDVVSRNRDERCADAFDRARQQAGQVVRQAYREASENVHRQVLATRDYARRKLASADAQKQTRLRLHRQQADQALLARAWEPLNRQLRERWQQPQTRELWVSQLVQQAATTLVSTPWHIEHPVDWPVAEQAALKDRLLSASGTAPVFSPQADISAGLRICAGQACVDGTLAGLVKSRARIDSLLLAKLNECRARLVKPTREHTDD